MLQILDPHDIDGKVIDEINEIVLSLAAKENDEATGGEPGKSVYQERICREMSEKLRELGHVSTSRIAAQKIEELRDLLDQLER